MNGRESSCFCVKEEGFFGFAAVVVAVLCCLNCIVFGFRLYMNFIDCNSINTKSIRLSQQIEEDDSFFFCCCCYFHTFS